MDRAWWNEYWPDVRDSGFEGQRISSSKDVLGADTIQFYQGGNSGVGAISLAIYFGVTQITLLGYDAKKGPNGEVHHHGDHRGLLGNAGSMPYWDKHFSRFLEQLDRPVDIINSTRDTALTCFPKMELEAALAR